MVRARLPVLLLFILFISVPARAQDLRRDVKRSITVNNDTIFLDSLSIVPGSVSFTVFPSSSAQPSVNFNAHTLVFAAPLPDSMHVSYRRFPYDFERLYFHKNEKDLYYDNSRRINPFTIRYDNKSKTDNFFSDALVKNGNISRGITFGNNQDVVVNSNLNLQVSGKLTPEIDLVMAATDNNIPFQPDGTTAQLQEFDKVYIQLSNASTKMIVGDYQLSRPVNSYFMNFYKRSQGIYIENNYTDSSFKNPVQFRTRASAAVSKGKFARKVFFGVESNQGPYRLTGASNEPFIIVLSGTERIYIDGRLLQRGQENDYIIDYNTGEITFTARQQITKDKRIVAEFQYAERNYSRSLFYAGEELVSKKGSVYMNFYSEQDNKNRPLQQTLSQEQKNVMIDIGDTLEKAYYSGAERTEFNANDVFYKKIDTLVNDILYRDVYVYTLIPDTERYRLRFSIVGPGKGNYVQIRSTANGKVYEWRAPVDGVPQGSYEPVVPLVTPKLQQMVTGGFTHSFTPFNVLAGEGVYTRNDINRFSGRDKRNDEGSGVKVRSLNSFLLQKDTSANESRFVLNGVYEFIQQRFTQIERFRSIEFERDWNRPLSGIIRNDQHILSSEVGIQKSGRYRLIYGFNLFNEGTTYDGKKQIVEASYTTSRFNFQYNGSYLTSQDKAAVQNSGFYRHKAMVSEKIRSIKLMYTDEFENNQFRRMISDSLIPRSYQFHEWEGSISNADSGKVNAKIFYRERNDRLAFHDHLRDSTHASNIGLQAAVYAIRNNPFSVLFTYRKLELRNVVGTSLKPDNTMLGRIEYNPRYFKGVVTAGVFYESGYGLENKREFYYLEVAPGQGQYAWVDYNKNEIRELNEFEVAQFADQARFIRIYVPTNDYIKVLQNQLSISVNIRPQVKRAVSRSFARFISRWALQTALRLDNKSTRDKEPDKYNPFIMVRDTFLIASNNNIRQSVFFNQGSAVFGAEYSYQDNVGRQLLTNGIEDRKLLSHEVKWRASFAKSWAINSTNGYSEKANRSRYFTGRNYNIRTYETEQRLSYQPGTVLRISGIYKYSDRLNTGTEGGQKALLETFAMEFKYNQSEKGSLTARADYIKISYNDNTSSPVAYEMLNGLNKGNNYTWELIYQRNLNSNIQVSINYNARKTEGNSIIHLGGAQVRAFF
jgi:hypothetical protein